MYTITQQAVGSEGAYSFTHGRCSCLLKQASLSMPMACNAEAVVVQKQEFRFPGKFRRQAVYGGWMNVKFHQHLLT